MVAIGKLPKPSISKTKLRNTSIKPPTNGKSKERKPPEKRSKVESRGKIIETIPSLSSAPLGSSEDSEDSGDDGVDEEGMARLMEVLGEDGLDELGKVQLEALAGDSGSEEEVESEAGLGDQEEDGIDEMGALSDESSEEDNDEDEGQSEMAIDEAPSVDEDAIPHQKLEVDNEVHIATHSS
jgi:rRNA-processing protein EBP2